MALAIPLTDPTSAAAAAQQRRVCAKKPVLYDTPGGFVVAVLARRDRVRVLRRSANRRWVHVRQLNGQRSVGWLPTGALCRA